MDINRCKPVQRASNCAYWMAIAWMYRDDYQRGGYLVLPRTVLRSKILAWQSLVPSFALVPMSIVSRLLGFEGLAYTAGAFVLSIAFTYYAIKCVAN